MKRLLQQIFVNNLSWKILSPFIWIANRLIASRKNYSDSPKNKILKDKADAVLKSNHVYNGPFKGMIYQPGTNTNASSYYAKLLGSYEKEIHGFIEEVILKKYDCVVNIGCDDGYYAVGMALQTGLPVIAYDINKNAISNTKKLAVTNNVSSLLNYGEKFTAEEIAGKYAGKRILYIADCEGDEENIFNKMNAPLLSASDIIVEMHLHIHPQIENHLRDLFSATHTITVVDSVPDVTKANTYNYPQLAGLDFETKYFITEERDVFMQWMYLKAKNR